MCCTTAVQSAVSKISESAAKAQGKTPCPKCIGSVYATDTGDYYHSKSDCSGMKGAKLMTVDQAELSGHSPCPTCMGGTKIEGAAEEKESSGGSTESGSTDTPSTDNTKITVYASLTGNKYHSTASCAQCEANAGKTSLSWALSNGYSACESCNAPKG